VTQDEPSGRLPADHLHRLRERGEPEDPGTHGEPNADALPITAVWTARLVGGVIRFVTESTVPGAGW